MGSVRNEESGAAISLRATRRSIGMAPCAGLSVGRRVIMRECELPQPTIKATHSRCVYIPNRIQVRDGVYPRPTLDNMRPATTVARYRGIHHYATRTAHFHGNNVAPRGVFSDTAYLPGIANLRMPGHQLAARKELIVGKTVSATRTLPVSVFREIPPIFPTQAAWF